MTSLVGSVRELTRHPLAEIMPRLSPTAFQALKSSIKSTGQQVRITLFEERILDGYERYMACLELGVEPSFENLAADQDAAAVVVALNAVRRQLAPCQRAAMAARMVTSKLGHNKHSEGVSIGTASNLFQVSRSSINRARKIAENDPASAQLMIEGKIKPNEAEQLNSLPRDRRDILVRNGADRQSLLKAIRHEAVEIEKACRVLMPQGRFPTIVADPPWPVDKTPYPTMSVSSILNDLKEIASNKAANDCYFFLWVTQRHLGDGVDILAAMGLPYCFHMTWFKPAGHKHPALPMFNTETILVGKRGKPKFIDTREFRTGFAAPRGRHSEKPQLFYDLVRRVTDNPRLELFVRSPHEGFEPYGIEHIQTLEAAE